MPDPDRTAVATSGAAMFGLASIGAAHLAAAVRRSRTPAVRPGLPVPLQPDAAVRAARRLNRAAGVLAASVLADSAVEHYRGSFQNRAMFTPLVTASLSLAVSAHGNADRRPARTGRATASTSWPR